ncbi:MAG: hypothetical protein IT427_06685 [Pirellulales bacterium]|nr:hypothetical protein [Pirellulales bacterium]
MSTFENHDYKWRETYIVLFHAQRRPTLEKVQQRLVDLNSRFELVNPEADEKGRFQSITIQSPQDFAAMDICYDDGSEVLEQAAELQRELKSAASADERPKIAGLANCDAKFDVLHFEQVTGEASDDEDDMLDPSALLGVLNVLADLTSGMAIDPQSGSLM